MSRPTNRLCAGEPAGDDQPHAGVVTMGLRGWLFQVAQAGALGLICLMFYQDRHESLRQAAEDRQLFREELREQRAALVRVARAVDHLAIEVRRGRAAP